MAFNKLKNREFEDIAYFEPAYLKPYYFKSWYFYTNLGKFKNTLYLLKKMLYL
jgi:hypothetical protein